MAEQRSRAQVQVLIDDRIYFGISLQKKEALTCGNRENMLREYCASSHV